MSSPKAIQRLDDRPHAADLELVRLARLKDPRAIANLTDRLACIPAMLRERHHRYGSPLSGDELAEVEQETLTALWGKLATFEGRASLETWAYRFTVNELLKGIDRNRRLRRFVRDGQTELDARAEPEREEPRLELDTVHACLDRIGPPAADVIRMRHFESLSFEDIARRSDQPLSAVKARYYRGLERLREMLSARWEEASQ